MEAHEQEEWLRRAQQGEPDAFGPLIHAWQQKLFAYCYYLLGNRQDAEDAVQEAFIRAYRSLAAYSHDRSFQAWLYRIAGNYCLDLLRRRKRWSALLPMLRPAEQERSAEEAYAEGGAGAVMDMLRPLAPEDRQLVILHVLQEQPFEDIALCLDRKPAALRKRYERLRKKLGKRRSLEEEKEYEAHSIRV
ncbi:hypothetical protein J31TS4_18610 [Paenibacillus sp. J31TS4]|uniref:RNA polymerase sigma factor n=1 Tax=Paenibacillus sp. J31TS4 TaxID=2807195 RepID=UPI001B1704FB|nr:RNA polymerase sigma factor [Paenibacillus sp. J31TS4]GIP38581.1 hypothetical protein J31TS4_18610 [Paenibacillus sp. J31TS4]